jgi:hypothetical protein
MRSREELAALARVWTEALSDLSNEELRAAVRHCLRTSRFPPTPAEVLAARGAARTQGACAPAQGVQGLPGVSAKSGQPGTPANPNVLTDEQFARRKAASEEFFRRLRERGIMGRASGEEIAQGAQIAQSPGGAPCAGNAPCAQNAPRMGNAQRAEIAPCAGSAPGARGPGREGK